MYEVPISLSDSINSEGMEFNAFIEPDESFLIFTGYKRPGGFGSGDLYISFNRGNDVWSKAENMGPIINSSMMDYCPFVKMDSGILYFTSKRNGISPNYMEKQTLSDLKKQMNVYENGLSRIYQIKFNPTGY